MKVVVVGHGPSLVGAGLGASIDGHDKVVRMKLGVRADASDYGKRLDMLVASTEVPGCFINGVDNYAYPKKGWFVEKPLNDLGFAVTVPINLCNMWNAWFRGLGGKHPNVSTGMAAIIIAAHVYRPKEIVLAGFDTLMDNSIRFSRNDAIPRTGAGPFPDHDWQTEKKLLAHIEQAYSLIISQLSK